VNNENYNRVKGNMENKVKQDLLNESKLIVQKYSGK